MEEEGRQWGHPIILPKRVADELNDAQLPTDASADPSGPQATGWLRGLEQMDRICPRTWAKHGIRAGRRIPADFRAPYCSILTNICQHHDEAVCRGWTEKQRRLEKLLLCVQGMLHKLETKEGEEMGSKEAATERARQLHGRHRAFMKGDFGTILNQESKKEEKGQPTPNGKPNTRSSEGPRLTTGNRTPLKGPTRSSHTSGMATSEKQPRP
jgi:hypothetical protein